MCHVSTLCATSARDGRVPVQGALARRVPGEWLFAVHRRIARAAAKHQHAERARTAAEASGKAATEDEMPHLR
jgi:hypothetical protein